MKTFFRTIVIFAIVCIHLSCSTNGKDKIQSFNVLYCKKKPSGLNSNNFNVIEYEGILYYPKIDVCYTNGKLRTLDVYKSDGILSYTNEDLKKDSSLIKYLDIPLNRIIIIQIDSISDNGTVSVYENRNDSIFVKKDNEILIYYAHRRKESAGQVFDSSPQ